MSFADTMMVGHYSTQALAAAAFVNSVMNMFIYLLLGYSYGLTPLISAFKGQGKLEDAGATIKHGLLCNAAFALLLIAVLTVGYFYLDRMGQPAEILPLSRPYYITITISLFFLALFNAGRQFTDGIGETSVGMWVLLTGNVVNIVLNYLLIYGVCGLPALGLTGAGLATLAARIYMVAALGLWCGLRKKYAVYRRGFASVPLRWRGFGSINRLSLPISAQMGMESGAFTFSGIMAGWLGAIELASFQVMMTFSGLGFLLYYSYGSGISIRVANCYGQRDWQALRSVAKAGFAILLVMAFLSSLVFYFLGGTFVRMFTTDTVVITMCLALIPYMVLYQLGDSMQICFANALRGTSCVLPMMWVAFVSYLLVNLPAGYLLAFTLGMGIDGLFLAFSLGLFVAGWLFFTQFRRVLQKKMKE